LTDREDKAFRGLGQMVVGMIRDVGAAPDDNAYAARVVTFPDGTGNRGKMTVLICKTEAVAAAAERGIAQAFSVENMTPKSKTN